MLEQCARATEDAIAFAAVGQRHDRLLPHVAGTQVKLTPRPIAEVHQLLRGDALANDGGVVLTVLVEPEIVIVGSQFAAFLRFIISRGSGIRHDGIELRGVGIQLLCELECGLKRFRCVTEIADHEAAVNKNAGLVGAVHELLGHSIGETFFHVLQNIDRAGFKTDAEFAASGFFHDGENIGFDVGARIGGPGHFQTATDDFFAQLNRAAGMRGEGVVFKKDFAEIGERCFDESHFIHHIGHIALAIGVTRQGLRNDAVGATERAAATGENDDQWIDVGAVEIALVAGEQMFCDRLC